MTLIECPWCIADLALAPATDTIRCETCLVEVEFAPDAPAEPELAAAA